MNARVCPACSAEYADSATFCGKCGTRLVALDRPVSVTPPASDVVVPRPTAVRMPASPMPTTRPAASLSQMVGEVLDKRYRIIKKLGEGGMSYVYLGHDVSADRRYAIKLLSPALSKEENAMQRLRREAAVGMRLEHPNVCHIVRLGETEDGLVYVVMPYVEGEILSDRTHRTGVVNLQDTAAWVRDIAAGLHVAHGMAIVHRDLKPENIMICRRDDGTEYAVVMDFGLAKERKVGAELEKLTATGIVLGTPEFMSPEQLRGKPLDPRSDIYSLALMTYEMISGKLPFEGRTQQEMMISRLRSDPIPIRQKRPDLQIPEAVEQVLAKGMAREADQRYQTAPEFAEALTAAVASAGSPPPGGLLGRLFGR
jgi:serine/threonine protein kinase